MGRRNSNRLSALAVTKKTAPGYYADGDGLYLQVSKTGSKSWILRFMLRGRSREMGLGSFADWTLAQAREAARKARQLIATGTDPIELRAKQQEAIKAAHQRKRSFEQCARDYHRLHAHTWKNAKHADQWINTLASYVFPVFGSMDVSAVSKADVLAVLEPMWKEKTETATRVRQRIRAVLDWAAAKDYRHNHDPHLWDQVARALPASKDVKKPVHFAACPYNLVYAALQTVAGCGASDTVKAALRFIVLTAARSGEVRGARWSEIDWDNKRWIIPAERMKAGREHRVPLSTAALAVLKDMRSRAQDQCSGLIFPSDRYKPFSDMTFTMLLRRLDQPYTVHGFRSTFRDWAAEQTAFPRDVCEAALAHASARDATEAAYFRSDLFEKRRQLMQAWADYCSTPVVGAAHENHAASPERQESATALP